MFVDRILQKYPDTFRLFEDCVTTESPTAPLWRRVNLFAMLALRHNETHRSYHTFDHIVDCLEKFRAFKQYIPRELHAIVPIALLYHDAYYDPERTDNEQRSGELAQDDLEALGWGPKPIIGVVYAINATTHLGTPLATKAAEWVADIDLSSLGARPEVFDLNTRNIRSEYEYAATFTPEKWRAGRLAFADKMLKRERIFYTDQFREVYEEKAQDNLKRTVQVLERAA